MNRRFLLVLVALVLVGSPVLAQEEPAEDVLDVLEVLAQRSRDFSLVVYSLDDPDAGIYHNANNIKRPLATTVKIIVLAEYARRVANDSLDPDEFVALDSVEVYYFPGTDKGAHSTSVAALRAEGRLANDQLTLAEIADAMIRYDDNAAADYLMLRFGREAMDALPERVGMRNSDAPAPMSGVYLNVDLPYSFRDDPSIYELQPDDRAWMLARRLRSGEDFSNEMGVWMEGMSTRRSYEELSSAALSFPSGTAQEYAGLIGKAYQGDLISEEVSAIMRDVLDYEMENASIRFLFDQVLATKSGSLAGVITAAYMADAKAPPIAGEYDPPPAVLALFIEALPADLFDRFLSSDELTAFELRLLTDPDYRELVRERLED